MELKDFDYFLPGGLIAQFPRKERDSSRLMVLERGKGIMSHSSFRELRSFLRSGDLLVLNDTKVMQARLLGKKANGGKIELLAVQRLGDTATWKCLLRPSKGLKPGTMLFFEADTEARVAGPDSDGLWICEFRSPERDFLERLGKVPLPPYIKREANEDDRTRYQTVFASAYGAVAAPTAGLHFTAELMGDLRNDGIELRFITLHTGPGTFMPVRVNDLKEHRVLKESYRIDERVFKAIIKARSEKRRVIAVGSTATRALEAAVQSKDGFDNPALEGETGLFIYPGFTFKVTDGLITNFHLPGSTLIMLVSAFAGHDLIMDAYRDAVENRYMFFSYGDAMLIL